MEKGIHILGVGNLGKYVAFALRQHQQNLQNQFGAEFYRPSVNPPPALIFHREDLVSSWHKAERCISRIATTDEGDTKLETASRFRVELLQLSLTGNLENREAYRGVTTKSRVPISHLIVATKAHVTVAALAEVRLRLGPHSHILFLQNGMGMSTTCFESEREPLQSKTNRLPRCYGGSLSKVIPQPQTPPNLLGRDMQRGHTR